MVVAAVYTRNIQYILITSLLPSFKLVISVFSTYATTKLFHNKYEILFLTHIPCLKDHFHNLTKYESKGTSKISL